MRPHEFPREWFRSRPGRRHYPQPANPRPPGERTSTPQRQQWEREKERRHRTFRGRRRRTRGRGGAAAGRVSEVFASSDLSRQSSHVLVWFSRQSPLMSLSPAGGFGWLSAPSGQQAPPNPIPSLADIRARPESVHNGPHFAARFANFKF